MWKANRNPDKVNSNSNLNLHLISNAKQLFFLNLQLIILRNGSPAFGCASPARNKRFAQQVYILFMLKHEYCTNPFCVIHIEINIIFPESHNTPPLEPPFVHLRPGARFIKESIRGVNLERGDKKFFCLGKIFDMSLKSSESNLW